MKTLIFNFEHRHSNEIYLEQSLLKRTMAKYCLDNVFWEFKSAVYCQTWTNTDHFLKYQYFKRSNDYIETKTYSCPFLRQSMSRNFWFCCKAAYKNIFPFLKYANISKLMPNSYLPLVICEIPYNRDKQIQKISFPHNICLPTRTLL